HRNCSRYAGPDCACYLVGSFLGGDPATWERLRLASRDIADRWHRFSSWHLLRVGRERRGGCWCSPGSGSQFASLRRVTSRLVYRRPTNGSLRYAAKRTDRLHFSRPEHVSNLTGAMRE